MAQQVKRGEFSIPAASSAQIEVSGLGFFPRVILFWWNGMDAANTQAWEDSHRSGFGWAGVTVPPTETEAAVIANRGVAYTSLHGAESEVSSAPGEADSFAAPSACIATISPGTADPETLEGAARVELVGGDGFYVAIDYQFAAALTVHYLALGGNALPDLTTGAPDITDVAVGTFTVPDTPGDLDVTDVGFEPECLFVLTWGTAVEDAVTAGISLSLGVATKAAIGSDFAWQAATFQYRGDASDSVISSTGRDAVIYGEMSAYVAAWLPNGFRLTVQQAPPSATKHYYLAIRGGRYRIAEILTSTVDTTVLPVSGVGFAPKAGLFISSGSASEDNMTLSLGAATGSGAGEQAAVFAQDLKVQAVEDATVFSDVFVALNYESVYLNASVGEPQAIEGRMALTSLDVDGLTCEMVDGDPSEAPVFALLIGEDDPSGLSDAVGYLRRGAQVRYFDASGHETRAYLDQASAFYGQDVNLMVVRVYQDALVLVPITGVLHESSGSGLPYWVAYAGQETSPPIMGTQSFIGE